MASTSARTAVRPALWFGLGLAALVAIALGIRRERAPHGAPLGARDAHPYLELRALRVPRPIAIDAEMDGKKVWESEIGSTGNFKDSEGRGMVPYSEAKVRWSESTLYLWLYAGDLDLEGSVVEPDGPVTRDDSFHVELGNGGRVYAIDVSVLGTVADAVCTGTLGQDGPERRCDPRWQSGAVVAVDRDGTLNHVGDNDEEWIVEMAIPLSSLGIPSASAGTRVPFAVRRCEIGKSGPHACGGFGLGQPRGEIVFDPSPAEASPLAAVAGGH
jgi:hypothetical protein